MTEEEYKVSIEQEVLSEYVSSVSANYFHLADKLGVLGDETHPVRQAKKGLWALKDEILDCETMQELEEIAKKNRTIFG